MGRGVWIAVATLIVVGCSSGANVVSDADPGQLEQMNRYDVFEAEVQFEVDDTMVYGTLTRPDIAEPVAAVVLVAGSGPTDRDWNTPLLPGDNGTAIELAERLGQAGIAVLRYDKRGTGQTELPEPIHWDHYLAEITSAVGVLRNDERIDGDRITLMGHSEGGAHALRAVVDGWVEVEGLVLLATAGRSLRDLVIDQVTTQLRDAGFNEESLQQELASLGRALDTISGGGQVEAHEVSEVPGLVALVESLQAEESRQFATAILSWDPATAIASYDRPVLIVNGLKDVQVDAEKDARLLYDVARRSNDNTRLALVENADHVLKYQSAQRDDLGSQHSLTYNDPTRGLDDAVFEAVATWLYELQK